MPIYFVTLRHVSVKMIEGEFVNEYTVHYLNYILPLRYTTSCHSPNSFKRFYEELSKDESLNQDIKRKLLDDKVTKELRLGLCNNATNVAEDEDYFLTLEGNLILSLTFGNVDFKGTETRSNIATFTDDCTKLREGSKDLDIHLDSLSYEEGLQWFNGVNSMYGLKEDYLNDAFEHRIDRYIKHFFKKLEEKFKRYPYNWELKLVKEEIRKIVTKEEPNRRYWDRRSTSRSCDENGTFNCVNHQGQSCNVHSIGINPYRSLKDRLMFVNTWELDHIIERNRTKAGMVQAIEIKVKNENEDDFISGDVNAYYFYELLCTMKNLTLVHRDCHDRTPHVGYEVDLQKILLPIPDHEEPMPEELMSEEPIPEEPFPTPEHRKPNPIFDEKENAEKENQTIKRRGIVDTDSNCKTRKTSNLIEVQRN